MCQLTVKMWFILGLCHGVCVWVGRWYIKVCVCMCVTVFCHNINLKASVLVVVVIIVTTVVLIYCPFHALSVLHSTHTHTHTRTPGLRHCLCGALSDVRCLSDNT